jgi:hypothetical protein
MDKFDKLFENMMAEETLSEAKNESMTAKNATTYTANTVKNLAIALKGTGNFSAKQIKQLRDFSTLIRSKQFLGSNGGNSVTMLKL